jgi:hypothetical protein
VPIRAIAEVVGRWAFNGRARLFKVHLCMASTGSLRLSAHAWHGRVAGSAEEQGEHGQNEQVQHLIDGDHAPLDRREPRAAGRALLLTP